MKKIKIRLLPTDSNVIVSYRIHTLANLVSQYKVVPSTSPAKLYKWIIISKEIHVGLDTTDWIKHIVCIFWGAKVRFSAQLYTVCKRVLWDIYMCMYIHVEPIHVYTGVDVHVHVLVNVDVALQFNRGLGATQILGRQTNYFATFSCSLEQIR